MKLGVFVHHVQEAQKELGISMDEMLDKVKALGIDYLELDSSVEENTTEFAEMMAKHGLKASNICYYYEFEKDPTDLKGLSQFRMAEESGAKTIMPIPGFFTGAPEKHEEEQENFVKGMQALAAIAEEKGLNMVIEDYDDSLSPISTIEGMKYLLDRIPTLNVGFDTGNFCYSLQDARDAYAVMKDRITHVHVKDRSMEYQPGKVKERLDGVPIYPCALGKGVMPIREIITAIKETGYDGIYVMEHYDVTDFWQAMQDSAAFMKELLG